MDWLGYALAVFFGITLLQGLAKKLNSMHDQIWSLESKSKELKEQVIYLERQVAALDEEVDRLKNPAYYAALDSGDYWALNQMDRD
ncbi:putative RNase H-like nuclease (RuvC/YqgF family) [Metapseudomonas resinovorans]|uniref:hypothetical protein n=1 Tax=Metapseudomonas resinovorans TaxID=53412 RepID=UPI003D1A9BA6